MTARSRVTAASLLATATAGSLSDHRRRDSSARAVPLTTAVVPSTAASVHSPYSAWPMVNSDDHTIVQPSAQPTRASGSGSPTAASAAMPSEARTGPQPGPAGRTFR